MLYSNELVVGLRQPAAAMRRVMAPSPAYHPPWVRASRITSLATSGAAFTSADTS
jgi:hypothetical protein